MICNSCCAFVIRFAQARVAPKAVMRGCLRLFGAAVVASIADQWWPRWRSRSLGQLSPAAATVVGRGGWSRGRCAANPDCCANRWPPWPAGHSQMDCDRQHCRLWRVTPAQVLRAGSVVVRTGLSFRRCSSRRGGRKTGIAGLRGAHLWRRYGRMCLLAGQTCHEPVAEGLAVLPPVPWTVIRAGVWADAQQDRVLALVPYPARYSPSDRPATTRLP